MTRLGIYKASMPMKLRSNVLYHDNHAHTTLDHLCDKSGGSCALVSPGWGKGTNGLVVAGEAVNTGLDENETAASGQFNPYTESISYEHTTWNLCPCG